MSSTVALTGLLPFVVLVASLLALPVCFVLLRLYRNAVNKEMATTSGGEAANLQASAPTRTPSVRLEIRFFADANDSQTQIKEPSYQRAMRGPWRASAIYAIAGLTYSLVMTVGWLLATRDDAIVWIKVAILSWTYLWPAILTISLIAAYDKARRLQLFGS